jgi:hypothetical protein
MFYLIAAAALAAAAPADTAPYADSGYPPFSHFEAWSENGYRGYTLVVDSVPQTDPRAPLFNGNQGYFYYLAYQAPRADLSALIRSRSWQAAELSAAYDSALRRDTAFTSAVGATIARFRASRGDAASAGPSRPLPVFSMDDAMQVAVRFFYPDAIQPDDRIQTHICVGFNGVRDLQRPRNLALEAFLFDAIQTVTNDDTPVAVEVQRLTREMNRADLSADSAIRVTRAQGFLWSRLAPNPVLRRAIRDAYEARKSFLPFVIAPDSA